MQPTFFRTQEPFRNWLAKNHKKENELLVGFYKVGSGKPSMSWSQSVEQALCYGWIDGVRKRIDNESYSIRFTPRKTGSIWSTVNIKKVEELSKQKLMEPSGIASFKLRKENKSGIYSHENETKKLSPAYEKKFKASKKAWSFFTKQAPSYQKVVIHLIMTAKQEKTQLSRLEKAIRESEKEKRIL